MLIGLAERVDIKDLDCWRAPQIKNSKTAPQPGKNTRDCITNNRSLDYFDGLTALKQTTCYIAKSKLILCEYDAFYFRKMMKSNSFWGTPAILNS